MIEYTSEFSEDVWIAQNLTLPDKGIYVDVGCAWPDLRSNTNFLRFRGWTGLAIDGNPFWSRYWNETANAKFINAVVSNKQTVRFATDGPPDMSRVTDGTANPVACRTLESILNEHGIEDIDFLNLDAEGHEFEIITSFNLARHHPKIIVAEYNTAGIGENFAVKEYLEAVGYHEVHRTVANIVFTK